MIQLPTARNASTLFFPQRLEDEVSSEKRSHTRGTTASCHVQMLVFALACPSAQLMLRVVPQALRKQCWFGKLQLQIIFESDNERLTSSPIQPTFSAEAGGAAEILYVTSAVLTHLMTCFWIICQQETSDKGQSNSATHGARHPSSRRSCVQPALFSAAHRRRPCARRSCVRIRCDYST
jgi:hypothetical protein